jgi:hypothetical protein
LRTDWAGDTDDEFDVDHTLMNLPWLRPSIEEQAERQSSLTDNKQDAGVTSFVKEDNGELVGNISRFDNASNAHEPRGVSGDPTTHLSEETTRGENTEPTGGDSDALLTEEPSGDVSTNPLATEPSRGDLVAPLSEEPFGGASTTLSATEPSAGDSNALLSIDTSGNSTAFSLSIFFFHTHNHKKEISVSPSLPLCHSVTPLLRHDKTTNRISQKERLHMRSNPVVLSRITCWKHSMILSRNGTDRSRFGRQGQGPGLVITEKHRYLVMGTPTERSRFQTNIHKPTVEYS